MSNQVEVFIAPTALSVSNAWIEATWVAAAGADAAAGGGATTGVDAGSTDFFLPKPCADAVFTATRAMTRRRICFIGSMMVWNDVGHEWKYVER